MEETARLRVGKGGKKWMQHLSKVQAESTEAAGGLEVPGFANQTCSPLLTAPPALCCTVAVCGKVRGLERRA